MRSPFRQSKRAKSVKISVMSQSTDCAPCWTGKNQKQTNKQLIPKIKYSQSKTIKGANCEKAPAAGCVAPPITPFVAPSPSTATSAPTAQQMGGGGGGSKSNASTPGWVYAVIVIGILLVVLVLALFAYLLYRKVLAPTNNNNNNNDGTHLVEATPQSDPNKRQSEYNRVQPDHFAAVDTFDVAAMQSPPNDNDDIASAPPLSINNNNSNSRPSSMQIRSNNNNDDRNSGTTRQKRSLDCISNAFFGLRFVVALASANLLAAGARLSGKIGSQLLV